MIDKLYKFDPPQVGVYLLFDTVLNCSLVNVLTHDGRHSRDIHNLYSTTVIDNVTICDIVHGNHHQAKPSRGGRGRGGAPI